MTLGFLTRIIKTQVLLEEQLTASGEEKPDTDKTGEKFSLSLSIVFDVFTIDWRVYTPLHKYLNDKLYEMCTK